MPKALIFISIIVAAFIALALVGQQQRQYTVLLVSNTAPTDTIVIKESVLKPLINFWQEPDDPLLNWYSSNPPILNTEKCLICGYYHFYQATDMLTIKY